MVRFRKREPDGHRMQVGRTLAPRRVAPGAPIPPRHGSMTGEIEAPRLPRCPRRSGAQQPLIALRPAQHRRGLLRKVRPGQACRSSLKAPQRHQRPVLGQRHRECRAIPRRPEHTAPFPIPPRHRLTAGESAIRRARHRGELLRKVRSGRASQPRLKAPERHRRPVRWPRHRERPAIPRRPEWKAPFPALVPTVRPTPTSRQST